MTLETAMKTLGLTADKIFERIRGDLERGLVTEARGHLDFVDSIGLEDRISVADELPPLDLPVWLFCDDPFQSVFIGCRAEESGQWYWCNCYGSAWFDRANGQWKASDAESDDDYKPTHWMRLPNPAMTQERQSEPTPRI